MAYRLCLLIRLLKIAIVRLERLLRTSQVGKSSSAVHIDGDPCAGLNVTYMTSDWMLLALDEQPWIFSIRHFLDGSRLFHHGRYARHGS